MYQVVRLFVRAIKDRAVPLGAATLERYIHPTILETCKNAIKFCIAVLKRVGVAAVNAGIIDMLQKYCVPLTFKAVLAVDLLTKSDATSSVGIVAGDRMAIATGRFWDTLWYTSAVSALLLSSYIHSSHDQLQRGNITQNEHNRYVSKRTGSAVGSIAGSSTGAFVGTLIFPVVGTFVGGFIGGMVGGMIGSQGGAAVYDELSAPKIE